MKTQFEVSAGGVVYKNTDNGRKYLMVAVKDGSIWTLPKGIVEKGEKTEAAALREVREEGGVEGKIETFLDKVELWFFQNEDGEKVRHHKIVYYYLIEYVSGDPKGHDYEVSDARWFDENEVLNVANYEKDKMILKKAIEYLRGE
ncbi:MAG TPA: NUDIX domain-containing protein [Candidatus Hydrothermia bacterium]|nr:NUDIX domain-containing protein [Candidatus Hydrothermae bacterium]MDD3649693.1 NUDIX domain-containing protein [Candidatus Hydrothermia bacterium]MDD5573224.1 NUDIX domain-containing protein [Candidatus Hydrothermia bacterium]HOK23613.1 NUDIX domain-containing protein [Candidatus Hydrothermia bacterium]HOL24337.1 NUDIX domain-containing protein [Candidatus Hydrothermia bacterium]